MEAIKEDFVSFETAKLLKEKGFEERIRSWYDNNGVFHEEGCRMSNSDCLPPTVMAPTLQMAMKWLREKRNFFIQITVDFSDDAYPMYDVCVINLAICTSIIVIGYNRYSYTQACDTAIKYCLENLI